MIFLPEHAPFIGGEIRFIRQLSATILVLVLTSGTAPSNLSAQHAQELSTADGLEVPRSTDRIHLGDSPTASTLGAFTEAARLDEKPGGESGPILSGATASAKAESSAIFQVVAKEAAMRSKRIRHFDMREQMTRLILLASTAFLSACATPASVTETTSAAAEPAAGATTEGKRLAALFEAYDAAQLELSPTTKAYRGIIDEDYGRWSDLSDEAEARRQALDVATLAQMRATIDPSGLSPADRLSYELFENMVARGTAAYEFRENRYLFDQMNGLQSFVPSFLINIHRVTDRPTAQAYINRLRSADTLIDEALAEASERAAAGVLPPRWVYSYVINDARNLITGAPFEQGKDSPLFADLKQKVGTLDIPPAEKEQLITEGRAALLEDVAPAYRRLIALMQVQQSAAPTDDGIWRLPRGNEYYTERLANYTTTDLTADEIHAIGLREVARIHDQMRDIMQQVGFKGTLQEFFGHLRTDPRYFYDSREAYLADVAEKLKAMEAALPGYFNTLPQSELVVKPVEAFREQSAGKAFYQRPAPDGSRPGIYYVNLYNLRDMSRTELEALAYHEGLPGHHLQLAIQSQLGDVPAFRRFGGVTAYSEGWGLYSEELGKDMGFYTDPYSDFGRLGMELWRAARLVVDTGLHDKRWSREQAIDWLQTNTPNPEGDVRKAIERYIVYPGQATAYMIGKLKIMELRERSREALGKAFDIGDFHDVVLLSGPLPLEVLESRVDAWITRGGGPPRQD